MAKILIVEDNEMNRDMLSRRLIRRGYEPSGHRWMGGDAPA
jgi:CheY-like chemotaxis protein